MLEPDRDQLEIFTDALFRHAAKEGVVSLRAFFEDDSLKPFRISSAALSGGLNFLVDVAEDDARRAANNPKKVVFCPPIATFKNKDRAREIDIAEGLALSVECDARPREAIAELENILGPATVVVASGGKWTDDRTGQIYEKLHLHWRLRTPARSEDLTKLKRARDLAARLVGGDPSNKPVCHPIRWPGSWHRKAEPTLCRIETATPGAEIDLATALTALVAAAPVEAASKANGKDRHAASANDWTELVQGIITGSSYHGGLVPLAAKLLTAGMSDGAAVTVLRSLMEASTGPHDGRWATRYAEIPRAVSTARDKGIAQTEPDAPPLLPPPLTIAEWAARNLPEPDRLLGSWLTTTSRGLVVAPTGLGKTNFGMALGMHASAGTSFLHWHGQRPVRILYVDGEMSRRLLRDRIADTARRLGSKPEGFHALSHEDVENFAPLNSPDGQAYIEEKLKEIGAELVIFDAIMCLIAGDMKDEESWRQTMPWIRKLTREGIGQLWLHHNGHDQTKSYGTKTREWEMDTVLHLEEVKRPDTDVSFSLEFKKARERTPATRADFQPVKIALVGDRWEHQLTDTKRSGSVTPVAMKFLDALRNALASDKCEVVQGRRTVTLDAWKTECICIGLIDADKKPDSARAMLSKYRLELIAANLIASDDKRAWLC
jgi:hypothetical protein